ncbi:MAG TPA: 5'-nucleotidase C-terminal domain-containing protein [Roseococcus sp.]|jgi:5'-nucleotidase|nr:5'-nucleotidase C-terminal domain-containing protein [Roseococcus sp.]
MLRRRVLAGLPVSALLASPALRPARAQSVSRVALLHLNDFHSRHEPIAASGATCRPGEACFGGSARIATAISQAREAARADQRPALLLEAGDSFMGSLFFSHHEGLAEAAVQRAWGVQGFALGNHEFDKGPATLARYIEAAGFPVLCANLDATAEPALAGRVLPTVTFRNGPARLVVVGLITPDTPAISSPGPNLRITDPAEAAERAVWAARREGPATVVLLSHLGLAEDARLAARVPGVDAIIGGHTHLRIAPPRLVDGPDRPVLIVQAGAYGRFLGRLDLDLAADGTVLHHAQAMTELEAALAEDAAVAAIVAEYAAPLEAVRRAVVGRLPEAFTLEGCREQPCAMGNFVAEAMRRAVGAEIGWSNAGALRTSLPAGDVTRGDTLAAFPFGNTVARLTLRGDALRAALENGLSRLPEPSGRFPQLAGLRFRADASRPVGERALEVEVEEAPGEWRPLDPARAYRIATNDFLRRGGDGYADFAERALEAVNDGPLLEEVVVRALGG